MPFARAAARAAAIREGYKASSNPEGCEAQASGEERLASERALHSEHTHEMAQVMSMEEKSHLSSKQKAGIKILTAPVFDYSLAIVIIGNLFIMIIEIDQSVKEEESASSWTDTFGWIVLTIFVLELLLRLFVFRWFFWKDSWNVFDFIVVVVDASFSIVGLVVGDSFPISILRIFRLAKLARVSKVLRIFPELRLLLAGLIGSARAIFWGVVLLVFILLVWAMIAVLFIHPMSKNMDCEKCLDAYDSVFHATLTFWQQLIAGDSWGQVTIPVIKEHPMSILFYLPLFMSVGMTVINLILGVVVNVALTAKDHIAEEDTMERKMIKLEKRTHLLHLCSQLDVKKTGVLSREQVFAEFHKMGEFQESLRSMDIEEEDLFIIWALLDQDKIGSLPYKALMNKLHSVRESDSDFMLAYIKYYITSIKGELLHNLSRMEAALTKEVLKVEEDLEMDLKEMVEQVSETSRDRDAHGMGQALDQNKQKMNRSQEASKEDVKGIGSCPLAENSQGSLSQKLGLQEKMYSAASTSIDEKGVLDKTLIDEINNLKAELQEISIDINQKLESQVSIVSLMNQRVGTVSSRAIAQGSRARPDEFEYPCHASI